MFFFRHISLPLIVLEMETTKAKLLKVYPMSALACMCSKG